MNPTKWAAMLIIALFVVSAVPFVAADEGSGRGTGAATATQKSDAAFNKGREELKSQMESKRAELQAKRVDARVKIDARKSGVRAKFEETRAKREAKYERAMALKEKRAELKQERDEARQKLGEVRGKLVQCAGSDTEECEEARGKARIHASNFMTRASEHILAVLAKARERIENSQMSETAKAQAIAEIDAALAEVNAATEALELLGENATKDDIKEAASVVREAWQKSKKAIKQGVGKAASSRIGGVIVKMEQLSKKFERVIAKLESKGLDTGAADAKKAEFDAKLAAAGALHAEAKTLFEAGDASAAAEKLRAAHAELKSAHQILKGLVQEIRGIGGSGELETETEAAEEESEDADDAADEAESEDTDEAAEETSDEESSEDNAGTETTDEGATA